MVGLEKVINKILASAETDAAQILSEADAECRAILEAAEEKAASIEAEADNATEAEGQSIISRARATAMTEKRSILLSGRRRAIDNAFAEAESKICNMPRENYLIFLATLAREAASDQRGGQCVITLNRTDRENIGNELLAMLRVNEGSALLERFISDPGSAIRKLFEARTDVTDWQLSTEDAKINGGLLLDFGITHIDCSVSAMIGEARDRIESDVSRVLFAAAESAGKNG